MSYITGTHITGHPANVACENIDSSGLNASNKANNSHNIGENDKKDGKGCNMSLLRFKDILFPLAQNEGFQEFELYFVSGDSFKVSVYKGEIDDYSVNSSCGLSFRGLYNGKMGYSYTEILDEDAAIMLVKTARTNAMILEKDDVEEIFSGSSKYEQIEGYYPALDEIGAEEKISFAFILEKAALEKDKRVENTRYCGVSSFAGEVRLINSKGLELSFKSNGIYAILIPVVREGDNVNTAVAYRVATDMNALNPEDIAAEAVDDAIAFLGAGPVASGKYSVVFKNEVAADLLDTFCDIFSAERVQKGLSLLGGKNGKEIASTVLTIIDDPLLKDGFASSPFDCEGVATFTKEVVKEGVLVTFLHNLKTAAKDGVSTTGNASKASFASPVDVAPSNFYIKTGLRSPEDLMTAMGTGLYITELAGLHSGADSVSGDFSLAAKGFLVEGGRKTRPVDQITIAGNFYRLMTDIVEAATDLRFGMPTGGGCFGSPSLLVRELSVAGE